MEEQKLTHKQQVLADAYLANGYNKRQAGLLAGYSPKSVDQVVSETFNIPKVKRYVEIRMKEAAEKLGISPEYRLKKLKRVIDKNIREDDIEDANADVKSESNALNAIKILNDMIGDCEKVEDDGKNQEAIREEIRKQIEDAKKEY